MSWLFVALIAVVVIGVGLFIMSERAKNARVPGLAAKVPQPACGGVLVELPPSGAQVATTTRGPVAPRSPLNTYSGSLTGTMLPSGRA